MTDNWMAFAESLPDELETVWLYNIETQFVALGCIAWVERSYYFAVTNGTIYAENGAIVSECIMDDYHFTHWHKVPKLPKLK